MPLAAAEFFVTCLGLYAAIGVVFALMFVTFGARRIDPNAVAMSLRARLIIFPGAVGLWPLLLVKVIAGRPAP